MEYKGKYIYIDVNGKARHNFDNSIVRSDTVEKQPFILPGVYDGLWSAYQLVIIFDNEKRSEPIKTIEGVRGINCPVKVLVIDDGIIYID